MNFTIKFRNFSDPDKISHILCSLKNGVFSHFEDEEYTDMDKANKDILAGVMAFLKAFYLLDPKSCELVIKDLDTPEYNTANHPLVLASMLNLSSNYLTSLAPIIKIAKIMT